MRIHSNRLSILPALFRATFYSLLIGGCLLSWQPAMADPEKAPAEASAVVPGATREAFSGPDAKYFTGDFSGLKSGVGTGHLEKIENPFLRAHAQSILKGQYDRKARSLTAEAYEPLKDLASRLKTSTYSLFENPTGIFFPAGEKAVIFVSGLGSDKAELLTLDFGPQKQGRKTYPLVNGVNVIDIGPQGLGYISYYTPNFKTAPKAKVHVLTGKVNGVFDPSIHDNKQWAKMLDNAVYDVIDMKGKYVHMDFPVEELKKTCPTKGVELVGFYDKMVYNEQDIMGLNKYKIRPKNRMSARTMYGGYMHADGIGAAFRNTTMGHIANEKNITRGVWAVSHELGHVNQIRPGFLWSGTIECTTNLYSCWNNFLLAPKEMRLENEAHGDGRGNKVRGGRFNAYLNEAVVAGNPWLFQNGPNGEPSEHFVKICALWQLQLYFNVAGQGNRDFYKDIFQIIRKTNYDGTNSGEKQMKFIEIACDVTKQDLSDFFIACGMLKPVDQTINDYGMKEHKITDELVKATLDKIKTKGYRKPNSPVIHYITSLSADMFRKKQPVKGQLGKGIEVKEFKLGSVRNMEIPQGAKEKALIISSDAWKNAVAYETYKGDKLERVAIFGTDSDDKQSTTRVQYPEGSTRVEAVGWDGKRTLVYGSRS